MNAWLRRWGWPVAKAVLAVAIVAVVGWRFWRDLQHEQLRDLKIQWGWLVLSGLLYFIGLCCTGFYWFRLLQFFGERPALLPAARAFHVSQLGKYLPGKAWALMMRGALIAGPDVKLGVALITTFYEVLTMMAAGAFVAAVLLAIEPPALLEGVMDPRWLGVLLAAVCGVPLLPGVFNRLVGGLGKKFPQVASLQLPRLRLVTLLEGLAITSVLWLFFGLSLWATVYAVLPNPPALTASTLARFTAVLALAYVGGFVAVVVPGGVGVREWVLDQFLAPELAAQGAGGEAATVVIVILLRLVWTAAEVLVAALLWWLPGPRRTV